MIDRRTVFEIHRLKDIGFSRRQIARKLGMSRKTVTKYIKEPEKAGKPAAWRKSKLDPYREMIRETMDKYPDIKGPLMLRLLREKGFEGQITIVREYMRELKSKRSHREGFIRFESEPGQQMQVDWGHFGSIAYGENNTKRKLYGLFVVESYSRMLYVSFTHSQKQEALHQGLLDAFVFFGGTPREILVDNMMTAVTERTGSLVRFNDAFLDFLRPFSITPVACNVRKPHEKGKVESTIRYIRNNFLPLREPTSLQNIRSQAMEWLKTVANVRIHQTTGERPADRFKRLPLRDLPSPLPDCRETETNLVHKDFAIRFDGNSYTVLPWTIGKRLVVKADMETVSIYHKDKSIAVHRRCWERKKRIELPQHVQGVKKLKKRMLRDRQIIVFLSLGPVASDYLHYLGETGKPIKHTVSRLLHLKDVYGEKSLLYALEKALKLKISGADYVENLLYREITPEKEHIPVELKNPDLNDIRLSVPSLAEYDATATKKNGRKND